ncbi:hypothetical protein JCM11251_003493 [Rhodosporidiobolus azoricus]
MSKELRITLRPPPHRDYLTGYPGIPASSPSDPSQPRTTQDPLLSLPVLPRPQAHLSGTVEIRSPSSGGNTRGKEGSAGGGGGGGGRGIRAKWLSVELEKIERVPPLPLSSTGGEGVKKGGGSTKKDGAGENSSEGRFVELIGTGPNKLWEAGAPVSSTALKPERTKSPNTAVATLVSPRKKGVLGRFRLGGKGKRGGEGEDEEDEEEERGEEGEEDGYEWLPDGNYPFSIPLPEGLPPTIEVDAKGNGVAYQIVATLCSKPKKSLLKSSSSTRRPVLTSTSAPILLDKADLLPWPLYFPLHPLPLPPSLPWTASSESGEPTVGETKEGRVAVERGREEGGGGEVWIKATRRGAAFGPGDAVEVFVQIGWGGEGSIKLTRLDFTLRETLTYRYPSPSSPSYTIRAPPKVTFLFTANASVSPDPERDPEGFAVLYKDEPVGVEMVGVVPSGHGRVTVRTAKHVDVSYRLKIRAMLEGGTEVSIDHWPVVLGSVSARVAKGIMHEIGWVEGLCERPGVGGGNVSSGFEPTSPRGEPATLSQPSSRAAPRSATSPTAIAPTAVSPDRSPRDYANFPPPAPSPTQRSYLDSQTEKAQLLAAAGRSSSFQHLSSSNGSHSGGGYHVANPSAPSLATATSPLPAPSPIRPNVAYASPSLTAEEEKRQYYDQATRSRDALQSQAALLRSSVGSGTGAGVAVPSPTITTRTTRTATEEDDCASLRSPASAEEEKVALHQAAVLRRSMIQTGLQRQQSQDHQPQAYPSAADEKQRLVQQVQQQQQQQASSPPRARYDPVNVEDAPLVARAHFVSNDGTGGSSGAPVTRSNTITAFSGSEVSAVPPSLPPAPSPQGPTDSHSLSPHSSSVTTATSFLGRSLTTAEAEKRRLFLDAKETARRRQEEARLELERQNRLLAEMEFEEAQNAYEERLVAEAEEEKREEERRVREAFEQEQRERIREEEERWAREEEERRRRAEQEREERRMRAERAMQDELRRFEEQQRLAEQEREEEIARQMAERKAEDEMKRRKAEELRRQDEEREREENERRLAASRKAEFERQRAEDERRRREGEEARRVEMERRQREGEEVRAREAQARARWEAEERARLEREREEEEERRRRHEAKLARLAAEAARRREENEARVRAEQEAASAAAAAVAVAPTQQAGPYNPAYPHASNDAYNHPAYPRSNGRSFAPAEHVHVERAPSVASFAPSMSAAAADVDFYALSIAQSSGLSSEKAAYLRQLRARDEERRNGNGSAGSTPSSNSHNRRPSQSQPPNNVYNAEPSMQQNLYSAFASQPAYPQLPQPPQPPSRQDSYIPVASVVGRYAASSEDAPAVPPLPSQPAAAMSSSSSPGTYKTAAQEKEEAAARRRAEDARGKQPAIPEDEELPPSYGVPGSATSARTTAAEEKAELERYYAAKAAVDAQQGRQAPPPPPARASSAAASSTFDPYMAGTPVPSYQPSLGPSLPENFASSPAYPPPTSSGPAYPQAQEQPLYTPQRSESTLSHSNEDDYRDPSIAAGKKPVPRQAPGSFGRGGADYTSTASAPSLLSPDQSTGYSYGSAASVEPLRTISAAARQDACEAPGTVDYGSFHLDDSFPEFEVLSNQISQANAARLASQNGSTM